MPNELTEIELAVKVVNTRTKSKKIIQEDAEWYATRLGEIVGGYKGKISPPTGYGCSHSLTIQQLGTVSNISSFRGEDLDQNMRRYDVYLRESRFVNKVSAGTAAMAARMEKYDPEVLTPDFAPLTGRSHTDRVRYLVLYSRHYISTLYELANDFYKRRILSRTDFNYIRMILLEGMHLYMEMYRMKDGQVFTSDLTSLEMSQMLQNVEGLIQYFTFKKDSRLDMNRFDIIHQLRRTQKYMLQAKTNIIDYL